VDESKVFTCQYHSTVVLHTHVTWWKNNRVVGGRDSDTYSYTINMIIIIMQETKMPEFLVTI
jgi:hypothetical protein